MFNSLCEINISDIDLKDERYKISPGLEDITFLAQSIKKIGLMTPPVVRPMNNHKFIIISGFNRIRAICHNNERKVVVYQTDKEASDYPCLLIAIAALAFKRLLTPVETIISIKRLSEFLDKKEIAKISTAVFNMQLNEGFIGDLLNIGSLPNPALELIQTGNLSLKSAKKISNLDKETALYFLDIFSKIKASASVQYEIVQNILEIAARDGLHPKSLFHAMKPPNPLYDETLDTVLRTHNFRTMVFDQRYPTLSKTRQIVQDKITSIKLPGTIKLTPPENFESRKYSVSFTVKNHGEFHQNIQHLTEALENRTLQEILNS